MASALPGLRGKSFETAPSLGTSVPSFAEADTHPTSNDDAIGDLYATAESHRLRTSGANSLLRDMLDISNVLTDGAAAMVDDSFMRCFTSTRSEPWNWNVYLWPAWAAGVVFRYAILFPARLIGLLTSMILLVLAFIVLDALMKDSPRKRYLERRIVQLMCCAFMMSWSAVIKYHGPRPVPAANRVWVSNHTSMIDYGILCAYSPFAVIMQLQTGWVRFLQTRVLNSLGCLWFNRTDIKDRHIVAARMKEHVANPEATPLLIFPEGTCVNNEYTVLFKRGAFDMNCTVCPVAIKYNKIFVDAFWNSRRTSFGHYLLRIMTSWALVCDVWFLEPQNKRDDETPDEFAARVQKMIADRAQLRIVPWDGYLKYYNLGAKNPGLIEKRRKVFADVLRQYLPRGRAPSSAATATAGATDASAAAAAMPNNGSHKGTSKKDK